jgi:general secretion pathway protein D
MPVGPSQGGSTLNLFDLDAMRRQQALGVPVPVPAYVPPQQPQPQMQPQMQAPPPVQTVPAQPATSAPKVQP